MNTQVSKCFPLSKGSKAGHPEKVVPISNVVQAIKENESLKKLVQKVRDAVEQGDAKAKEIAKKNLPCITPAAVFKTKRNQEDVEMLTGLTVLDFDHVPDVNQFKEKLKKVKFVFIAFVSPSGDGVKVIIRTPAVKDRDTHVGTFLALKEFFNSKYLDDSGKDYTRLCFLSHDTDIYVNENAESWTQQVSQKSGSSAIKIPRPQDVAIEEREEVILRELRKIHPDFFTDIVQNRNNETMKRAAMFCDYGLSEEVAKNLIGKAIQDWKDFENKEFEKAISQGYKNGKLGSKTITKRPDIPSPFSRGKNRERVEEGEEGEIKSETFSRGGGKKSTAKADVVTDEGEIKSETFSRGGGNKKEQPKEEPKQKTVLTFVDEVNDPVFWYYIETGKGEIKKRTLKMDMVDLLAWLAYFGYASTKVADEPKLVRIVDNVVEVVTCWDIKHFVINWLDERFELNNREQDEAEVKRMFLAKPAMTEMKNLSGLPPVEIHKLKDKQHSSRIYFENCVCEITKNGIKRYKYNELKSLIWKAEINGRILPEEKPKGIGHYEQFIANVSNLGDDTAERNKLAFETTIGYLVHTYKNPSITKMVITNDSQISIEGASSGRSGKGLFGKSLGHVRSSLEISGKTLNAKDKFWLQLVKPHHQIVNLEDLPRKFDWESLYNLVTDDWTIEQKFQGSVQISAAESPRIIASTNFTVSSLDPSTLDRIHNLEFSTHYHAGVQGVPDHRPEDDFGCKLFFDWFGENFIQWAYFDYYIIHCIQQYLKNGLVSPRNKNLKKRQLINAVGMHVVEWIEDAIEAGKIITFDEKIASIAVHNEYVAYCRRNNIDRFDHDQRSFTSKLYRYFRDNGYKVNTEVKAYYGNDRVRGFIVSKTDATEKEIDSEQLPPEAKVDF